MPVNRNDPFGEFMRHYAGYQAERKTVGRKPGAGVDPAAFKWKPEDAAKLPVAEAGYSAWPYFVRLEGGIPAIDQLCFTLRKRPPAVIRLWGKNIKPRRSDLGYAEFRCSCGQKEHDCFDVLVYRFVDAQMVASNRIAMYEQADPKLIGNYPQPSEVGSRTVRVTMRKGTTWEDFL